MPHELHPQLAVGGDDFGGFDAGFRCAAIDVVVALFQHDCLVAGVARIVGPFCRKGPREFTNVRGARSRSASGTY